MRRLVYSPKVYAYVKTDSGLINISDYVVSGSVSRKVDMVSSAELTIRNPDMKWTKEARKGKPVFRPMDPITIWLQRLRGKPVQVFTGYLDRAPYLQLYPGPCILEASCTLKRLQHTFWDPALPFSWSFLQQYGWFVNEKTGGISNRAAEGKGDEIERLFKTDEEEGFVDLTDGSIGRLLFAVLKHVGDWKPDQIYIEELPQDLIDRVMAIYTAYNEDAKETRKVVEAFIKRYIGDGSLGEGGGNNPGGPLVGGDNPEKVWNFFRSQGFSKQGTAGVMGSLSGESASFDPKQREIGGVGVGIVQWTSEPRRGNLLKKKNWDTLEVQLDYIMEELKAGYQGLIKFLKSTRSVESACDRWTDEYERPGTPHIEKRQANARRFYQHFKDKDDANEAPRSDRVSDPDATASQTRTGGSLRTNSESGLTSDAPVSDKVGEEKAKRAKKPVKPLAEKWMADGFNNYGEWRDGGSRQHAGEDWGAPDGTPLYACEDGKANQQVFGGYGNCVDLSISKGRTLRYAHLSRYGKKGKVNRGDVVGYVGNTGASQGAHLHFEVRTDGVFSSGSFSGTIAPKDYLSGAETPSGSGGGGGDDGGDSGSPGDLDQMLSAAKAAAFVQDLEFPGIMEQQEAITLDGPKSLMNDKPLLPYIESMTKAAMRRFQSLPNGHFYAFYPDYFGDLYHRTPYWNIDDIEIIDAQIELTDDALATHVFGVGDTVRISPGIDRFERMFSSGVVNIFNVTQSGFTIDGGPTGEKERKEWEKEKKERLGRIATNPAETMQFLQKYGARPHLEEAPFVRSPYYEVFLAYQTFQKMWSAQFLTEVRFTFMPELYPGGLVGFPEHGLQVYLEEVTHTFSYESGFSTEAQVSAPATLSDTKLASDPLSFGLVRAGGR